MRIIGLALMLMALAACAVNPPTPEASVRASAAVVTTDVPLVTPRTGFRGLPVDTTLTPVSLGNPPNDAERAMALCVRGLEDRVAGMAKLPAREVHRFMLTNGNEPELQTDAAVWAVQYEGAIPGRRGNPIDALCVAVGTDRYLYAPYGVADAPFSAPPDFVPPTAALPPIDP